MLALSLPSVSLTVSFATARLPGRSASASAILRRDRRFFGFSRYIESEGRLTVCERRAGQRQPGGISSNCGASSPILCQLAL